MTFLKIQKLVKHDDKIVSGSASIADTEYVPGAKYHARHKVLERLGKVLYLRDDRREGIFQSPTRGLVLYNADTQQFTDIEPDDPRIAHRIFSRPLAHTVFGDAYLLLRFLKKSGLLTVLKQVFPKKRDYQRLMGHILHGVLRDGSRIHCSDFLAKSFVSGLINEVSIDSFKSDTQFYERMGADGARMAFFQAFVKLMRKTSPGFGRGCYVDSTPLPNDIRNNPFNALSRHGVDAASVQMRLVLVLDEETGLPVWYDIIPGNVLDLSTTMTVMNDVAVSLDVEIRSLVLDAGYVTKGLLQAFNLRSDKKIIGRMPARRGFPYKQLYWGCKPLMNWGKYDFVRNEHTYFGHEKDISLFGVDEYAYVYVDKENALAGFRKYLDENEEEFRSLKDKDKDWLQVKSGYFVLVSNRKAPPREVLKEYFERTSIELVFKTGKEYLGLLPLSKWTNDTVRGKILHDIIDTIIVLLLRRQCDSTGFSLSEIFGRCQSLMCCNDGSQFVVETPNKQTRMFYALFGEVPPSRISLAEAQCIFNDM